MSTILLVEDELNQRLLYQMELEDDGYRVVLASDGWEALQQVREEHPDLVGTGPGDARYGRDRSPGQDDGSECQTAGDHLFGL